MATESRGHMFVAQPFQPCRTYIHTYIHTYRTSPKSSKTKKGEEKRERKMRRKEKNWLVAKNGSDLCVCSMYYGQAGNHPVPVHFVGVALACMCGRACARGGSATGKLESCVQQSGAANQNIQQDRAVGFFSPVAWRGGRDWRWAFFVCAFLHCAQIARLEER